MYICHLGSMEGKMFKHIPDVWTLIQWGASVPKTILLSFRKQKIMNICRKESNMWLIFFTAKISRSDSPKTNQGPFKRTLLFWGQKYSLDSRNQRRESKGNVWIDNESMPFVYQHIGILDNGSFEIDIEFIDKVQQKRRKDSSSHRRTVARCLLREGLTFLQLFYWFQLMN